MFSFHPTSHHLEACPEAPLMQMGQPTDTLLQRQQTDNLSPDRNDGHGLERELQFADLEYRELQAMS
ncbi:hypothetical protein [Acidovorax sp. ACV01]|uniref:hypothetical protein n=1 Tax=Acidovorax sp. ACV01 TaxID=2769311 RepID=UPI00177E61CF|nr:hypothetical protein [Acidovorax sp. ACV01]MBD9393968.1 hypothetical protein [Acidovorax sp. ACV01]